MRASIEIPAIFAIVLAAASNSAARAPAKSIKPAIPHADEQKFDLLCDSHSIQTGEKYNDEHLSIDLNTSTWCRADVTNDCDKPKTLTVLGDELWMYRGLIDTGSYGTAIINHYVNRKTGLIRFERQLNGVSSSSEGMCTKRPYDTDIPNKF